MTDEVELNRHLDDFQKAVQKLGSEIKKSEINWNDAQFHNLSDSIRSIAAASKQVLVIGGQCRSAIKRFNAIESEK